MQQPSIPAPSPAVGETTRLREPAEKLDPNAKKVWIIGDLVSTTVVAAITCGMAFLARLILDLGWLWVILPTLIVLALGAAWITITPTIRYNQWRFEIREDEVDLLHGILVRTRQVVPMSRIQHVDTTRGPIQRRYGLSSVVFYTAAGAMTIPELSVERAAAVRDQIAALAKVHDDL